MKWVFISILARRVVSGVRCGVVIRAVSCPVQVCTSKARDLNGCLALLGAKCTCEEWSMGFNFFAAGPDGVVPLLILYVTLFRIESWYGRWSFLSTQSEGERNERFLNIAGPHEKNNFLINGSGCTLPTGTLPLIRMPVSTIMLWTWLTKALLE